MTEPSREDLSRIENQPDVDPLEDLFAEATAHRSTKLRKPKSPHRKPDDLDRVRKETYTNPDNWLRVRGVALIDRETQTLIGNFSEYRHKTVLYTRKWIREHSPIEIEGTEEVEGYLGERIEQRIRNVSWGKEHQVVVGVQLDELMVGAPDVSLLVKSQFGGILRADLIAPTQFASVSGNTIIHLPAGTNIWEACSTDTKISIKKEIDK